MQEALVTVYLNSVDRSLVIAYIIGAAKMLNQMIGFWPKVSQDSMKRIPNRF